MSTRASVSCAARSAIAGIWLAIAPVLHAGQCPPPPACPPATVRGPCDEGTTETFTFSTTSCFGTAPSETMTLEEVMGGPNGTDICIGAEKSEGFFVCPGTTNYNTNFETVYDVGRIFADSYEQQ